MPSYKTPGVYVKEVSVFPPSVAQVETAVPAFVGYTEQADLRAPDDLHLKPKKIESLLEYRQYFGGAPPLNISKVDLGTNADLKSTKVEPQYLMFHSLQLFFNNGGGKCYIISVGKYGSTVRLGDRADSTQPGLDSGLAELEKVDEPTIIVFPDALLLSAADMYTLQKTALQQCNDLQDRVAVFDLRESDDADPTYDWEKGVEDFRNNIGTSFLKYGAAYAPHLRTNLLESVSYRQFRDNDQFADRFTLEGTPTSLFALRGAKDVPSAIDKLEQAANDLDVIENEYGGTEATVANAAPDDTLKNRADVRYGIATEDVDTVADIIAALHNQAATDPSDDSAYQDYVDYLYELVVFADGWIFDSTSTHHPSDDYRTEAETNAFPGLLDVIQKLVAFDKGANTALSPASPMNRFVEIGDASSANVRNRIVSNANYAPVDFTNAAAGPAGDPTPFSGADDDEKRRNSLTELRKIAQQLLLAVEKLVDLAKERYQAAEDNLGDQLPSYKNLLGALEDELSTLPPSGAIAGIYARVDENRGVWKAPANESLNSVTDLTVKYTDSDTDGLNVNDFGKSVNAIKFFTGRGHLVWGARTLAGNDNEWRYISVRRFFNMVEESVKKSTMWAVFEPNESGTWLKVRGMIQAFLTLQWRDGALQGAKPDDAFFVKIGLGETMTPLDILEGRMIVEIGMAVVRPAEFIILKFMHKMVQSG